MSPFSPVIRAVRWQREWGRCGRAYRTRPFCAVWDNSEGPPRSRAPCGSSWTLCYYTWEPSFSLCQLRLPWVSFRYPSPERSPRKSVCTRISISESLSRKPTLRHGGNLSFICFLYLSTYLSVSAWIEPLLNNPFQLFCCFPVWTKCSQYSSLWLEIPRQKLFLRLHKWTLPKESGIQKKCSRVAFTYTHTMSKTAQLSRLSPVLSTVA